MVKDTRTPQLTTTTKRNAEESTSLLLDEPKMSEWDAIYEKIDQAINSLNGALGQPTTTTTSTVSPFTDIIDRLEKKSAISLNILKLQFK